MPFKIVTIGEEQVLIMSHFQEGEIKTTIVSEYQEKGKPAPRISYDNVIHQSAADQREFFANFDERQASQILQARAHIRKQKQSGLWLPGMGGKA